MHYPSFLKPRIFLVSLLTNLLSILTCCSTPSDTQKVEVEDTKANKSSKEQHSKFRQECALTSSKFRNNLPSGMVEVWCADDNRTDFGAMGPDVIHAMVVAAFYDKRMDRRVSALNLLERYDCPTETDCEEFLYLLDWGIKSGRPQIYSKNLAERANTLRAKTRLKLQN